MIDIGEEIDNYLLDISSLSPQTVKTYFNRLDRFERWLGDSPITEEAINSFLDQFSKHPRTYNLTLTVLHKFFSFLVKSQYITENPCKNIERLKERKTKPEPLLKEEIELLFEIIGENNKIRIPSLIMLYGGARINEALNTRKKDFYLENETLFIRIKGKGNKDRTSYVIQDNVKEELLKYLKTLKNNDKLTSVTFQRMQKWAQRHVQKKIKKFKWHRLRKTFATLLAEHGLEFEQIQSVLGHENSKTTEIYTKHFLNKSKLVKLNHPKTQGG